MKLINAFISIDDLISLSKSKFGNYVKAVVDIEREIIAIDADLHADEEAELLKDGSKQQTLWGINIYPEADKDNWIEFDSMINLRPTQGNRTRSVDDPETRKAIIRVVEKLVQR